MVKLLPAATAAEHTSAGTVVGRAVLFICVKAVLSGPLPCLNFGSKSQSFTGKKINLSYPEAAGGGKTLQLELLIWALLSHLFPSAGLFL